MIEQLFGVVHGGDEYFLSGRSKPLEISPSLDLRQALDNVPRGKTVGIEYYPAIGRVRKIDGRKVRFSDSTCSYWEQVAQMCIERGLGVLFLDNLRLTVRAAKHHIEAKDWEYLAHESFRPNFCLRMEYAHQVIGDYILEVLREKYILEEIARRNPDVVVLGKDHVDYLALCPEILKSMGINVSVFTTEEILGNTGVHFMGSSFNKKVVTKRLQLCRKYNTVTKGRIDPDGQPDLIGFRGHEVPREGLFEVYLDDKGGKLIDIWGDAIVSDILVGQRRIYFEMEYCGDESSDMTVYEAYPAGNKYSGSYRDRAGSHCDDFVVVRYQPGMKLQGSRFIIEK